MFGILPQDALDLEDSFIANDILPSLQMYNRLQDYLSLIPANDEAFLEYALEVYPGLYSDGPSANPDYGVGWHLEKSFTYDAAEALERTGLLEGIIALYYPAGQPAANDNPCVLVPNCPPDFDNNGFVGVNDVLLALGDFGCAVSCTADLNGDGSVGVTDILLVLSQFGLPCY